MCDPAPDRVVQSAFVELCLRLVLARANVLIGIEHTIHLSGATVADRAFALPLHQASEQQPGVPWAQASWAPAALLLPPPPLLADSAEAMAPCLKSHPDAEISERRHRAFGDIWGKK